MKRIGLALVLALTLTFLPGGAWASHRHHHGHHGFHRGCCVFVGPVGPVSPFFPHPFGLHRHFFFPPSSTFIVVDPAPQQVWVPGSWWWNGFQWVWWPGHWVFLGQ